MRWNDWGVFRSNNTTPVTLDFNLTITIRNDGQWDYIPHPVIWIDIYCTYTVCIPRLQYIWVWRICLCPFKSRTTGVFHSPIKRQSTLTTIDLGPGTKKISQILFQILHRSNDQRTFPGYYTVISGNVKQHKRRPGLWIGSMFLTTY